MAQRHEIEAWVNPQAWDDPARAQQVIEAIVESGSDDEADWSRIAFGEDEDPQQEAVLAAAAADYQRAATAMDEAQEKLHAAIRDSLTRGMPTSEVARISGMTRQWVHRISQR